ncbi:hypothetical protein ACFQXA_28025 [Nocardiopsis composta]
MRRTLLRGGAGAAAAALLLAAAPVASADPAGGIGDPYFPDYGNTGYDVGHYDLRLDYAPDTDRLAGTATLVATATEDLDSFTLDFLLDVDSVRVNGKKAGFSAAGEHKVEVVPAAPVAEGERLTVVVKYADVPSSVKWGTAR